VESDAVPAFWCWYYGQCYQHNWCLSKTANYGVKCGVP